MEDGALRYSLILSPNTLPDSPLYFSGQFICGHLNWQITPLFCNLLSLSLGAMRSVFMVFVPLKCTCVPLVLHVLLNFSHIPCMYGTTMEIIRHLVGQSPHHLKNTHFLQHIQKARLEPGEVMTSYDVKALFSSVPVDPSIHIVQQKLTQNPTQHQKTHGT